MGRWGMRLFEGDQDIDIAIEIDTALGKGDDMNLHLSRMINQTDLLLPPAVQAYYKTEKYLKTELKKSVTKCRNTLDSGICDQLFRIFRAKENSAMGKYRVIILGALMMRAGAKIKDEDLQHLRDLVPLIQSNPGLAASLLGAAMRPLALLMAVRNVGDDGFRQPGRAQFLAALDNYKAGVPRSFLEPRQIEADIGQTPSQCAKCKAAWYCNEDCQKAHWKDHKPACIAPESRTTFNV
ncbi:hypothetical protein VMCG_06111 [Cytospora schulzeri]|uniref:MYND-type domain-containing protein n=1 Tax=Cytospora schulzeri TaxID=448051 RepID=A0A423WGQ0_9PEZI|nr:hypothetical protein VMCG_06111 [Valsa malicola]